MPSVAVMVLGISSVPKTSRSVASHSSSIPHFTSSYWNVLPVSELGSLSPHEVVLPREGKHSIVSWRIRAKRSLMIYMYVYIFPLLLVVALNLVTTAPQLWLKNGMNKTMGRAGTGLREVSHCQ
ncbi:hypothetical protein, unlikely [Trypanosoma brucei gambiense DAL972]|uniref:Uncharacterized protein n=1 Tax=Trypanosoma brucei gambiense (strain MHOM/CI/86/DAL972) TaxID=679716 RepID=C9ZKF8_TRYB9|nr:hypothetical protein, unlikely [Trypanosoma brucei gambiense DAL972]CBH09924.1 hypothetical protein, unlikely [Trypanosoma brucei gambiense DAL972]|eukprot:XP_011772215.1 hypothetical protein, unlikely [Trypanosoma brucei gambiense DAL972]